MPEDYISKIYNGMHSAYSKTGFKLTESEFRAKMSDSDYAGKVYEGMSKAYSSSGFKLTQEEFNGKLSLKKKEPTSESSSPGPKTSTSGSVQDQDIKTTADVVRAPSIAPNSNLGNVLGQGNQILSGSQAQFTGQKNEPKKSVSGGYARGAAIDLSTLRPSEKQYPDYVNTFGQTNKDSAPVVQAGVKDVVAENLAGLEAQKQSELSLAKTDEQKLQIEDRFSNLAGAESARVPDGSVTSDFRELNNDPLPELNKASIPTETPEGDLANPLDAITSSIDPTLNVSKLNKWSEELKDQNAAKEIVSFENLSSMDIDEWSSNMGDEISEDEMGYIKSFQDFTKSTLADEKIGTTEKYDILEDAYSKLQSKMDKSAQDKQLHYEAALSDQSVSDLIFDKKRDLLDTRVQNLPENMAKAITEDFEATANLRDFMSQYYDPTGRKGFTIKDGVIDISGIKDEKERAFIEKKATGYINEIKANRDRRYAEYNDEIFAKRQVFDQYSKSLVKAKKVIDTLPEGSEKRLELEGKLAPVQKVYDRLLGEIQEKEQERENIFMTNPKKVLAGISNEISDTKSIQEAFSGEIEGLSPYENFERSYLRLEKRMEELMQKGDFDASRLDQFSQGIRDWLDIESLGLELSEEEKEYMAIRRTIHAMTPIFMNNSLGTTEESSGFIDAFMSGAGSFLTPNTSGYNTETKIVAQALNGISKDGLAVDKFNNKDIVSDIEERLDVPWNSMETAGEMTGVVAAVMADLALSNAVVVNPALSIGSKSSRLKNMANAYDKAMDSTKVGRFLKPHVASAAKMEVAGDVIGSSEDELNFQSGLLGALGGEGVKAIVGKLPVSKAYSWVASQFGSKTDDAVYAIKRAGEISSRSGGEVGEEFVQELVGIYNSNLEDKGFWETVGDRFGDFNENMKFVVGSALMGAAFSFAEPTNITKERYDSLTPEQKTAVDSVINEGKEDIATATEASVNVAQKFKEADKAVRSTSTPKESVEPISNIDIKEEEGGDVEYKIDDKFYSEEDVSDLLEDPNFIDKVEKGEVKVEFNNPSTEISEKVNPTITEETITEERTDGQTQNEVYPTTDKKETTTTEVITESTIEAPTPTIESDAPGTRKLGTPKDNGEISNYDRKFVRQSEPSTPEQVVMRAFMNGSKLKKETIQKETGLGSENRMTGNKKGDGQLKEKRGFYSVKDGLEIDSFIETLREDDNGMLEILDDQEVRDIVLDIIDAHNTIGEVSKALAEEISVDGVMYQKSGDRADAKYNSDMAKNAPTETEADKFFEDKDVAEAEAKALIKDEEARDYKPFESAVTKGAEAAENWLDELDAKLKSFGEENLGMNIPLVAAQAAVKAAKIAVKAGGTVSSAIDSAIEAVKQTDWYKNEATEDQKLSVEDETRKIFSSPVEKPTVKAKSESKTEVKDDVDTEVGEEVKTEPKKKSSGTSKSKDGKKDRSLPKNMSEEIRDGLSEEGARYIPITNKVTAEEAKAIIDEKGSDEAMRDILDFDNKMELPVRIAMGIILMEQFKAEGTAESLNKTVEIGNTLAQEATKAGQAVQAFSLLNKLSTEGLIVSYENQQTKAGKELKKKNKGLYSGSKEGYREGTKKASKKATDKVFGKNTPKVRKAKAFNMTKDDIKKKKAEALKKLKDSLKKGGGLTSGGVNTEAVEALGEYGFLLFADGVRTFKEWAAEMRKATGITDQDALNHVWANYKAENGKTLEELSKLSSIEKVVENHFSKGGDVDKLSEKLQETFNIDEDLASGLASELTAEFERVVSAERKKEIKKRTTGRVSKKVREAIDSISESDNLNDKDIESEIEKAFGIKLMTDEQKAKIKELSDERDLRPEGFLKDEATRELLSEIEGFDGISKKDLIWSIWYASILSGHETQMLNIGSNALNMGLETIVTAIEKGPRMVAENIKGTVSGSKLGFSEFIQVLSKGYSPEKMRSKIETKDALESKIFVGGKFNPINYYKYVGRFMTAVDTAAYMTSKGARSQELAYETAKKEGLKGKELQARVSDLLNNSEAAYDEAQAEAVRDIKTMHLRANDIDFTEENIDSIPFEPTREQKRLINLRRTEIIEANVDEEITQKAKDFASFVTFNYDPEGLLGYVATKLSETGQKIQGVKLIAPFTRIVANVLNQQLDYTPYGALRAYGVNFGAKMDSNTKAKDVRDRNRKLIKATLGTALLYGLYSLVSQYSDDEDPYIYISGKGPTNFNKRSQLMSQGWRPYSVKIGDKWISYQYTPLGLGLSFVGNWVDNERYGELSEKDASIQLAFALGNSGSSVMDMSFLTGLGGFMSALNSNANADTKAEKMLNTTGKIGTSFIPNLFKQIDKSYDPTIYDADTFSASILKEIPIVKRHSGLKPKLNAFGQDVKKDGDRFSGNVTTDENWLFMSKHRVFAPVVFKGSKTLDGEEMSSDQYYDYIKFSGQDVYEYLTKNKASIERKFEGYTQAEKDKYISKLFSKAKKRAKKTISKKQYSN